MDDDHTDLVAQLCTRVGMIMEDGSVIALNVGRKHRSRRKAAIDALEGAATRIQGLIAAVRALSG